MCKFDRNNCSNVMHRILLPAEGIQMILFSRFARNFEFKFDRENSSSVTVRVYVKVLRRNLSSRFTRKYKCTFDREKVPNVIHRILLGGIHTKICFDASQIHLFTNYPTVKLVQSIGYASGTAKSKSCFAKDITPWSTVHGVMDLRKK